MSATVYATLRRNTKTFTFLLAATGVVVPFVPRTQHRYLRCCVRGFIFVYSNAIHMDERGPECGAAELRGSSTAAQEAIKEHV